MQQFLASALTAAIAAVVALPANGQSPIKRRIETVSVVPAANGSGHDVHIVWTLEASSTSAGLNASTVAAVFVGPNAEVPSALDVTNILLDFTTGICGFGGCSGGCGSGFIDGVFNTMLCLEDSPCGGGGCDCTCRFPYITTTLPSVDFEPGNQLTVVLYPAPNAFPEVSNDDDAIQLVAPDQPLFWDRSIASIDVQPSSGGPAGTFDIDVAGLAQWRLLDSALDLGFEVQLYVNGNVVASAVLAGIAGPPGPGQSGCDGSPSICSNGCGSWNFQPVECELWVTYPSYLISCECGTPWILGFAAVPLDADDDAKVVLKSTLTALPALPGSGGDDGAIVILPSNCPADLDGSGEVGGGDLGILLANWGRSGQGDLNGDGTVDGGDLGVLLADWGPCVDV